VRQIGQDSDIAPAVPLGKAGLEQAKLNPVAQRQVDDWDRAERLERAA